MDKLKELFGSDALTFEQLTEKLKDNKEVKLANLAAGGYVDKAKYTAKEGELATAKQTITDLQEAAKKWDGVDVDKLRNDMATLQSKYDADISAARLDNALSMAIVEAKAKNPKLVKAALDTSVIKLDGEKLLGFSEQIEGLKKSDAYLFDIEEEGGGDNTGGARFNTGAGHKQNLNEDSFMAALMKGAGLETEKKE